MPALFLVGAGMGLAMAPFFNIVLAGVDNEETGSASGALTSVQQLGGAFGIAVLGTLFFALLPGSVTHHVDSSAAQLRTVLVGAGVPAEQEPAVAAGLRACLHDTAAQSDPDVVPASCRAGGPQSAEVTAYVHTQVRGGFADTTIMATGASLGLLVLAFGLSFLLPKRARPEDAS